MSLLKIITKYRRWIISAFLLLFLWWAQSALWSMDRVSSYFLHLQHGDRYYLKPIGTEREVDELVERNLNDLVFLPSSEFNYGYYKVDIIGYDGNLYEDRLAQSYPDRPTNIVEVDNFYISKYEITNRDIDIYLGSTGLDIFNPSYDKWRSEERPLLFLGPMPRSFFQWIRFMIWHPQREFEEDFKTLIDDETTELGYSIERMSEWGRLPATASWDTYCTGCGILSLVESMQPKTPSSSPPPPSV